MNKKTLKTRVTALLGTLVIAGALTVPITAVGGTVTADRADAYSDRSCHLVWKNYGWQTKCWRDYTWWEENCLYCWRGVDGWVYKPLL